MIPWLQTNWRSQKVTAQHLIIGGGLSAISAVLATLLWGFQFGVSNNEYHTMIVYKIAEGLTFAGDAMAATLDQYASVFWWLLGYLSKLIPPIPLFCGFFILSRFGLNMGLGLIVMALSGKKGGLFPWVFAAGITCASGFLYGLPLGADPVIETYLSQTYFSIGICLISLALTLLYHQNWSAFFLGIAYNINLMQANFLCGLLLMLWFIQAAGTWRTRLLASLKTFGLAVLVAAPTVVWVGSSIIQASPVPSLSGQALADFAKYNFPYHFFWSFKTFWTQLNGLAIPGLLLLLVILSKISHPIRPAFPHQKEIGIAAFVLLGYIVVGAIGIETIPSRILFQLHLFRSDVLGFTILIVSLVAWGGNICVRYPSSRLCSMFWVTLLVTIFHRFVFSGLILASIVLFIVIDQYAHKYSSPLRWMVGGSYLLISVFLFWKGKIQESIFFLIAGSLMLSEEQWLERWRIGVLAGMVMWGLWGNLTDYRQRVDFQQSAYQMENTQINQLARMAYTLTPSESLFLIPPIYLCRASLHRGVYLSMKDGSAYLWKKGAELEYLRRLRVVGITYTPGQPYQRERVYQEFLEHLPSSLPQVKAEGVTHVILPKIALKKSPSELLAEYGEFVFMTIDMAINQLLLTK